MSESYGDYGQGQQYDPNQQYGQQQHEQQHAGAGDDWLAGATFQAQGQPVEHPIEVSIADIDHSGYEPDGSDTMYA